MRELAELSLGVFPIVYSILPTIVNCMPLWLSKNYEDQKDGCIHFISHCCLLTNGFVCLQLCVLCLLAGLPTLVRLVEQYFAPEKRIWFFILWNWSKRRKGKAPFSNSRQKSVECFAWIASGESTVCCNEAGADSESADLDGGCLLVGLLGQLSYAFISITLCHISRRCSD